MGDISPLVPGVHERVNRKILCDFEVIAKSFFFTLLKVRTEKVKHCKHHLLKINASLYFIKIIKG